MEITSEIERHLDRLAGCPAEVHEYRRFGGILRLCIEDEDGENWVMSFTGCHEVRFRVGHHPFKVRSAGSTNGLLRLSDEAGFLVVFKQCFLIHEDEYLAADGDSPPQAPRG